MRSIWRQLASSFSSQGNKQDISKAVLEVLEAYQHVDLAQKALKALQLLRRSGVLVRQNEAYVVEKFGKYNRVLEPGYHRLYPAIERIAYTHRTTEFAVNITSEPAVTKDRAKIRVNGIVGLQIIDAKKASYAMNKPVEATTLAAHSCMRDEIAKMTLDRINADEGMSDLISSYVRGVAKDWGVSCTRYDIRSISTSERVRNELELEAVVTFEKWGRLADANSDMKCAIIMAGIEKSIARLMAECITDVDKLLSTSKAIELTMYAEYLKNGGDVEAAALLLGTEYIESLNNMTRTVGTSEGENVQD